MNWKKGLGFYFSSIKGLGFYFLIIKRDWNWVNEDIYSILTEKKVEDVYGIDQYYNIIVHIDQIII